MTAFGTKMPERLALESSAAAALWGCLAAPLPEGLLLVPLPVGTFLAGGSLEDF